MENWVVSEKTGKAWDDVELVLLHRKTGEMYWFDRWQINGVGGCDKKVGGNGGIGTF